MDMAGQKPPLNTSMLYMWRCLVAIVWADGDFGEEETSYFEKVFDNLLRYFALTQEQRDVLADDLMKAKKIDDLFPYINDPEVRGMLLDFAHELAVIDGALAPSEDDILKRLSLWAGASYDKTELLEEIRQFIAQKRRDQAEEKDELRAEIHNMSPLYAAVDRLMLKLGFDLIE